MVQKLDVMESQPAWVTNNVWAMATLITGPNVSGLLLCSQVVLVLCLDQINVENHSRPSKTKKQTMYPLRMFSFPPMYGNIRDGVLDLYGFTHARLRLRGDQDAPRPSNRAVKVSVVRVVFLYRSLGL